MRSFPAQQLLSLIYLFFCGLCARHFFAQTSPRFEIHEASVRAKALDFKCPSGGFLALIDSLNLIPINREHEGATARIYTDSEKTLVLKVLTGYKQFAPDVREACVLQTLSKFVWAPKVHCVGAGYVLMTNMGETACQNNTEQSPIVRQLNQILSDMQSVGVKHNDLSKKNLTHVLMGNTGMVSLVDYGWASLNGTLSMSCTLNGHVSFAPNARPHNKEMDRGRAMQETVNSIMPYMKKCTPSIRSQSENPVLSVLRDGTLSVTGYHSFTVSRKGHVSVHRNKDKYDIIDRLLRSLHDKGSRTFVDIGSNTGVVSFLAAEIGYTHITALDHDAPAVDIVNKISADVSSVVKGHRLHSGSLLWRKQMSFTWVRSFTGCGA